MSLMTCACKVCSTGGEKFGNTWLERSQAKEKMKDGGNGPGFVVDVNVGQF